MARLRTVGCVAATAAMVAMTGAVARADPGVPTQPSGVVTVGNGFLSATIESGTGTLPTGAITLATGPANPLGAGLPLLWGGTHPGSSWLSVDDYTLNETSTQQTFTDSPGVGRFDQRAIVTVQANGSTSATWAATTSFDPSFTQTVKVLGSTFADSEVVLTTTITNKSVGTHQIGVRQLLDLAAAADDGPTLQPIGGPVLKNATAFPNPGFSSALIEDNDTNPFPPTFGVTLGLVSGGALAPTLVQYTCAAELGAVPFSYNLHAAEDVADNSSQCSTVSGGDSALALYWGDSQSDALTLASGASVTLEQTFQVVYLHPFPTVLHASPIDGPNGLQVTATLKTTTGVPVAGRTVTFRSAGKVLCSSLTSTSGVAACASSQAKLAAFLAGGFTAAFPGDGTYLPSSASATRTTAH